jgi:hypothetical protein
MNGLKHCDVQEKSGTKEHILYYSIDMKLYNREDLSLVTESRSVLAWGQGRRSWTAKGQEGLFNVIEMFYLY